MSREDDFGLKAILTGSCDPRGLRNSSSGDGDDSSRPPFYTAGAGARPVVARAERAELAAHVRSGRETTDGVMDFLRQKKEGQSEALRKRRGITEPTQMLCMYILQHIIQEPHCASLPED